MGETRWLSEDEQCTWRAFLTAMRLLGGGEAYEAYLAFDEITYGPVVVKVVRPARTEAAGDPRDGLTHLQAFVDTHDTSAVDIEDSFRGIILTQKANFTRKGVHFWSRIFAPWYGINEDPVCGSAHTGSNRK